MTLRAHTPNVEQLGIARVYADAVWNLAVQRGVYTDFLEEFDSLITDVLDREPDLEVFFELSSIGPSRRAEMLEHIFAGRASELMYDFLRILNDRDRLGLLRAIGFHLQELADRREGTVPVLVRTAAPLPDDQRVEIEAMITRRFGVRPTLETQTDPDLLGGLWIRIADTVYDNSVRWHLRQLRDSILTRSSHEIRS